MDFAESRQRERAIVGTVVQGRASLGRSRTPHYKGKGKERRLLILEEMQAGVEEVSPSLRHFAKELAPVLPDIFNTSLMTCYVPACFKSSTIVPVPKKPWIIGLNDYRPVVLTFVLMKSFERLVLTHLKTINAPLLDPLQFAYRTNRPVDDAVNLALHFILQHLDSPGSFSRISHIHILQRIVRTAKKVIGCRLPSLHDLHVSRSWGRAGRITADPTHPGHRLFNPLPSGRRLQSIWTRTSEHRNSFFPFATRLMNTNQ